MIRPFAAALLALLAATALPAQREGGGRGQGGGGKGGNRPPATAPGDASNPAGAPQDAGGKSGAGKDAAGRNAAGKDAPPPPPADPEVVKAGLKAFHAMWPKASIPQKVAAIEELTKLGGEDVAEALAAKLADKEAIVRKALAEALGTLKQPKSIPQLGNALAREIQDKDGNLPTIQAVCQALGAIGDAKAIPALTDGVFAGNTAAENWNTIVEARLAAVGQIKDKASVDALIDLLGKVPASGNSRRAGGSLRSSGGGNSRVQRLVENPLRKLTRQSHEDVGAWRDWWKDARAKFAFA